LIQGESGTGKELIAHLIHDWSSRKDKPFVALHCAALTETLLASELFGHERGSFTGATERKIGRFERAHSGSLFLDEVGEISKEMQVKLLRVLQEGELERVGGTKTIKVDVRLVTATNKILFDEVKKGNFREDLYYRLNVILIETPPLRERTEDIPLLVDHFIKEFARANDKKVLGIDKDALEALKKYSWPGNIRELKNIIERMVVLTPHETLGLADVPQDIASKTQPAETSTLESANTFKEAEKELIIKKLTRLNGNKSKAAKELGISRRTLYRKLSEYNITL
jgi:transcriptional regulator with PAS, ATPase and Fis domain